MHVERTGNGRRKGVSIRKNPPGENALLPRERKLELLAEALSNPMDTRTSDELGRDLGMSPGEIARLQSDPLFMEPITANFRRGMGSMEVFIFRKLFRLIQDGNLAAARLAIQTMYGQAGTQVNILNMQASSGVRDDISSLTDEDLDRQIHELIVNTSPDESFVPGKGVALLTDFEEADAPD